MTVALRDALGRSVRLDEPPKRIVSLVPSETESVVALGARDRLVGRTEWCEEPVGRIEAVPTVGGTKDVDVDAVLALDPDLVLANQEENTRRAVERLAAAGLTVHVSFPVTVEGSLDYVARLAAMLGVAVPPRSLPPRRQPTRRVFAPIWRDPWMTFDRRTYASDLLGWLGLENVFAGRPRRYPLAADLGEAPPRPPGERDTRYPRVRVDEIRARRPELILLPDEPFRFEEAHVAELEAWGLDAEIRLVSGKDLFWYGTRSVAAIARLGKILLQK